MVVDLVIAYQNLNSGNRRMNGRNSSLLLVGSSGPSGSSAKNITKLLQGQEILIFVVIFETYSSLSQMRDQFWV